MKPTIDQQIDAVECVHNGQHFNDEVQEALAATLKTLRWVKLKTKPALGSVMEAFPGAKVVTQDAR